MNQLKKTPGDSAQRLGSDLYAQVRQVLLSARSKVYSVVNESMVQVYYEVGRIIVEDEQAGASRAKYGKGVLDEASSRLTSEFGSGFTVRNLRNMRQFFLLFSKRHPLRAELSWTHYRHLLRVEDEGARVWYMNEAANENWSTRQLERQIGTLYYERILASKDQSLVRQEAEEKLATVEPEQFIKDPYVLEFLDLKDYPGLRESEIETALIDNLQMFLLELGKGFSFVSRQKRMRFDDQDFYIDLVFYNFILKRFVLVDLKLGTLTHQDIGQMDGYVRIYEEHCRQRNDNPTIGLILCSKKNEAVAKYSVLKNSEQLFASKYKLYLPDEDELKREIEKERKIIETRKRNDPNRPHVE